MDWLRSKIIPDVSAEWHKASTWLTTAALAIWGTLSAFPSVGAQAWNAMPADLRAAIPHQATLSTILFAAILAAKFWKQRPPPLVLTKVVSAQQQIEVPARPVVWLDGVAAEPPAGAPHV
jgi:hypothetical protein